MDSFPACIALVALLFAVVRGTVQWRRGKRWTGWLAPGLAMAVVGWLAVTDLVTQKMVGRLVLPVGLLWCGLGLLAVLLVWRRQVLPALLAWMLFLGLGLAGNRWFGAWLTAQVESSVTLVAPAEVPPLEALFVLGGGTGESPLRPQLSDAGDRVCAAAECWHAGRTKVVVVSGITILGMQETRSLAQDTAGILQALGLPADAVRTLDTGRITREEVAAYKALVTKEGWTRIGLVTSAWHMPRALRLCRAQGLDPVPVSADRRGEVPVWSPVWLVPDDVGVYRTRAVLHELAGMMVGR